jgi:hypothetical protein
VCFDLQSRPRDMALAKKAYLAIKTAEPDIAAANEEVTALDGSAFCGRACGIDQ